jgi:hypothetical protein
MMTGELDLFCFFTCSLSCFLQSIGTQPARRGSKEPLLILFFFAMRNNDHILSHPILASIHPSIHPLTPIPITHHYHRSPRLKHDPTPFPPRSHRPLPPILAKSPPPTRPEDDGLSIERTFRVPEDRVTAGAVGGDSVYAVIRDGVHLLFQQRYLSGRNHLSTGSSLLLSCERE